MPTIEKPKTDKPDKRSGEKDPLLGLWKNRLNLAETKWKKAGAGDIKSGKWNDLIRFFQGEQWQEGQGGTRKTFDRITANQAKSNIDAIRPQLYFQNPRVKVTIENPELAKVPIPETNPDGTPVMEQGPMGPVPKIRIPAGRPIAVVGGQVVDAQEQVELLESVDNHHLAAMGVKPKVKRVINDSLVLPYGVGKLEWVVELEKTEEVGRDGNPTGKQVETVASQYPRFTRVKPWQFIWDYELDEFDLSLANWVSEIKYLSRRELEDDPNLKVDFERIGEPVYWQSDFDVKGSSSDDVRADVARYKVYEIHDLRTKSYFVYVDGAEEFARRESPSAYDFVEGSIYTVMGFDECIDDSLPMSPVNQIKTMDEAHNKVISYMVNHVGRHNRKYAVAAGMMKPEEEEKLERGADGTVVKVEQVGAQPVPIADANIPPDAYNIRNILKGEINEAIGISSYSKNVQQAGVDTATEASYIQTGQDIKIQDKRDVVREFMRQVVRKLNQMLKKFADQKSIIEIAGEKGTRWVEWSREDIRGEFLEDVDIYSSMPFSAEIEKKQAMEFFSLAAADPYFNPIKLRKKLLRTLKLDDDLVYSEQEYAQIQMQQQAAAAQADAAAEGQRQASRTIRPSEGQVERKPDMQAGILGQARRG